MTKKMRIFNFWKTLAPILTFMVLAAGMNLRADDALVDFSSTTTKRDVSAWVGKCPTNRISFDVVKEKDDAFGRLSITCANDAPVWSGPGG